MCGIGAKCTTNDQELLRIKYFWEFSKHVCSSLIDLFTPCCAASYTLFVRIDLSKYIAVEIIMFVCESKFSIPDKIAYS